MCAISWKGGAKRSGRRSALLRRRPHHHRLLRRTVKLRPEKYTDTAMTSTDHRAAADRSATETTSSCSAFTTRNATRTPRLASSTTLRARGCYLLFSILLVQLSIHRGKCGWVDSARKRSVEACAISDHRKRSVEEMKHYSAHYSNAHSP